MNVPNRGNIVIGRRAIKREPSFDGYFAPESEVYGSYRVLSGSDVYDTVQHIARIIKQDAPDTVKIANKLKRPTRAETVEAIHAFMWNYLQYENEKGEKLRRPARTWHVGNKQNDKATGNRGVDCDDMAIFSGSILYNLGIPYFIRIVKVKSRDFEHVYLIVPKQGNTLLYGYYTLDGVISRFDYEHPYKEEETFDNTGKKMKIEYLGSLGNDISPEVVREFLTKLREIIKQKRELVLQSGIVHPDTAVKYIDVVLANWDNPEKRNAYLLMYSQTEQRYTPYFRVFTMLSKLLDLNPPVIRTDPAIVQRAAQVLVSNRGMGDIFDDINSAIASLDKEQEQLNKDIENKQTSQSWFMNAWGWISTPDNLNAVQSIYNLFWPTQGQTGTQVTPTSVPNTSPAAQNPNSNSNMWLLALGIIAVGGGLLWAINSGSKPKSTKA